MALVQLSVVEQRLVAVRAVPAGARVGEVAASLGVSRQSVDAWTCAIWPPGSLALRIGRIGRGRARGRCRCGRGCCGGDATAARRGAKRI